MDATTDREADEAPSSEEAITTSDAGIHVRKVASMFNEDAVAVDLTLRSERADRCTVEVTDGLPDPLLDNHVEFHPHFDPDRWSREDDRVVYRAPIGPGVVRRTVYGVTVDEPGQLSLFSDVPTVEVDDPPEPSAADAPEQNGERANGQAFAFDQPAGQSAADAADDEAGEPAPLAQRPRTDEASGSTGDAASSADDVVAALVDAIRDRDLSESERTALREALGLEEDREARRSIAADVADVKADLEALREEVAETDRTGPDLEAVDDRIEALSAELQSVSESLSADLDELHADLEREVRWRSKLRQSLAADPDDR